MSFRAYGYKSIQKITLVGTTYPHQCENLVDRKIELEEKPLAFLDKVTHSWS